jgi:hypothetical protein
MIEKKEVRVNKATLKFVTYTIDTISYLEFDSSQCEPPEPMINAMYGFLYAKKHNLNLIMINMQEPKGLYDRVKDDYSWDVEQLESGDVKITFSRL